MDDICLSKGMVNLIPSAGEDEDRSETSTREACHVQPQHHFVTSAKVVKKVHFKEHVVLYVNRSWYKEDCASRWYTLQEYQGFKNERTAAVKKFSLEERRYQANPNSFLNVLEQSYATFCGPVSDIHPMQTQILEQRIRAFVAQKPDCVGLESMVCFAIGDDRQLRREEMLETMREFKEDFKSPERRALAFARACGELSRPSVLFAQFLAQAVVDSTMTSNLYKKI